MMFLPFLFPFFFFLSFAKCLNFIMNFAYTATKMWLGVGKIIGGENVEDS